MPSSKLCQKITPPSIYFSKYYGILQELLLLLAKPNANLVHKKPYFPVNSRICISSLFSTLYFLPINILQFLQSKKTYPSLDYVPLVMLHHYSPNLCRDRGNNFFKSCAYLISPVSLLSFFFLVIRCLHHLQSTKAFNKVKICIHFSKPSGYF